MMVSKGIIVLIIITSGVERFTLLCILKQHISDAHMLLCSAQKYPVKSLHVFQVFTVALDAQY